MSPVAIKIMRTIRQLVRPAARIFLIHRQAGDALDYFREHLHRRLGGIDIGHELLRIVIQDRFGLRLVGGDALVDHLVARVVDTVVLERALAHPAGEFVAVRAGKMEDLMDLEILGEHFRLADIARDAVEHEKIDVRLVDVGVAPVVDLGLPEVDRELVRHQFAAARILDELLAERVRVSSERNTSPHAQWKNRGMVPRILPWVPLPEPGAPRMRNAGRLISSAFDMKAARLGSPDNRPQAPIDHCGQGQEHRIGNHQATSASTRRASSEKRRRLRFSTKSNAAEISTA